MDGWSLHKTHLCCHVNVVHLQLVLIVWTALSVLNPKRSLPLAGTQALTQISVVVYLINVVGELMQIYTFISSQKLCEFWDGSYTQEFNESPVFLALSASRSSKWMCLHEAEAVSQEDYFSCHNSNSFSRSVWPTQEFPVSNRFTHNPFHML